MSEEPIRTEASSPTRTQVNAKAYSGKFMRLWLVINGLRPVP
jgi:hypothetical protein